MLHFWQAWKAGPVYEIHNNSARETIKHIQRESTHADNTGLLLLLPFAGK